MPAGWRRRFNPLLVNPIGTAGRHPAGPLSGPGCQKVTAYYSAGVQQAGAKTMTPTCFTGSLALLAGLCLTAPASAARTALTILHTNDLHGHLEPWDGWGELEGRRVGGLDRIATVVKRVRAEVGARKVLLLDGGDTIGDTMIAARTEGRAIVNAMNAIGYDAMVVGNHEPDFGPEALAERMREARFPVLAANIVKSATGEGFATPYRILEVNGVRVGVLGLAYPNTALTTARKNVAGLNFRDSIETAREFVPRMRAEGAALVVVLSHFGLSSDEQLARQVPGIDVIVGGHSHNRMRQARRAGETLIVQAGAHGSDVGRLDLEIENGRIVAHRRELILVDNGKIAADPETAASIDASLRPHTREMKQTVGKAGQTIARAQTLGGEEPRPRDEQSPADALFADIVRNATATDVAMLPGVGYGVALAPGPIRAADLRNLIPHESKVVTMTLTGAQIREILEQSLENTYTKDPRTKVGGLVQVSGLVFAYRPDATKGSRLQDVRVGGRALEAGREYRVATNSLLAEGGHNYTVFQSGKNKRESQSQYELVRTAIEARGTVTPPQDVRIVKHEDGKN